MSSYLFMLFNNVYLQCMSNTEPLRNYFLRNDVDCEPLENDINKNNPLGMGGAIAKAFQNLLKEMWSGSYSSVDPGELKVIKLNYKYTV